MPYSRLYLLGAGLLLLLSCQSPPTSNIVAHADEEAWISLFNGRDLTGWTPKIRGYETGNNFGNTFQVRDSVLTVSYEAYDTFHNRFGHLFYQDPFSYYRLRVRYRFVGDQAPGGPGWAIRNSGLMLHGQSAESMGLDQDFPISIEMQLLGGNGSDPRTTANLCTPGTHVVMGDSLFTPHCINSSSSTYHLEQWVNTEVLVLGDSMIQHYVEGDTVLTYYQPQMGGGNVFGHDTTLFQPGLLLSEGSISLQSESHPIEFSKVELLNLKGCKDPKAKNYKSYLVKHDAAACIYDD